MSIGPPASTGSGAGEAPAEATSPPTVRRVPVFVTVALALLMMSIDSTIVATALHSMQTGLGASINWAGWTITAYSFGFVLMLPVSGRLSERYGRRRVFLASVAAFTIASLLCGLAQDIFTLIALRAVQAAGGAGFTPSATGIIVDHFGDQRDRAVSLFGSIFPIGAMIGPIFGGLFVTYWTWRGVFFVNVPIGLLIVLLTLRYVPRDRSRAADRASASDDDRMDVGGMLLLGTGLLAGMLAVSFLGERGAHPSSLEFVVPALLAIALLWWFFHHIAQSRHPFIAPRLIHGKGFGAVNLVNTFYGGVTNGVVTLIPLYAVSRYGIDDLGSGTLLIAQAVAAVLLSVSAALALRRTGHRLPLYVGGSVIAAGMFLLALEPPAALGPWTWLALAAFVVGAGRGAINPASRNAGLQLAPEHSSTLAALRTASLQIGSITTVSIVTAVLAVSGDPGAVQARVYALTAIFLLALFPLIVRVPEHHGSW